MWQLDDAYINGAFVPVSGTDVIETVNPATGQRLGTSRQGSRQDARLAIAAAVSARQSLAGSSVAERIEMLQALHRALLARTEQITAVTIEEYGGPVSRSRWVSQYAAQCFLNAAQVLREYSFHQKAGDADVFMEPAGVAALIAPWNSTAGTVCSKLAYAIAAGCTSVIKPSEFSPIQNRVVAEALHDAGLPAGVFNILSGRGDDVGDELTTHPQIARISFTGSTAVGKMIARSALDSMKRLNLGLSGKSASLILEDADAGSAIPMAVNAAFLNNGQACVAGSRLLVPESRLAEITEKIKHYVAAIKIGDPADPETQIGPLASQRQFDNVQRYIRRGLEQGAQLIAGGEGRPSGLTQGFFVKPCVFTGVSQEMDIAREEIFGPVLSVISYKDQEDAIRIANDSVYGLQAYIFTRDEEQALPVARQLQAGTVLINRITPDLMAPFGGVKQSGLGREFGIAGLEFYLEAKTIVRG